ncbi:RBBP9/YdeN family alpha/beta hydrolase [Camelimonas abortus]|uniref:RBBP9/YdeN family alpha/beta hydrolase n=1 Tax=Camelimonas abortus TaxID=1017184 RepID=A0ABV7LDC1_9HYPH
MKAADCDILIIPGWAGSGPDHWQTRWRARLSTARLVEQADWSRPRLSAWCERLLAEAAGRDRPQVLVAHSLGCILVAAARLAAATAAPGHIAGAWLAAPPSERAVRAIPGMDPAFTPFPREPLPFPAVVVASSNDPYCPQEDARALAGAWGARFLDAGESGHLNVASGHGPWPDGVLRFAAFLRELR